MKTLFLFSLVLVIGISNIGLASARSLGEDLDLLATKDQKLSIIKQADNNTDLYSQIRNVCADKSQFYDILESCMTFLEKFNYHMNLLWNDSRKQVDEIGK